MPLTMQSTMRTVHLDPVTGTPSIRRVGPRPPLRGRPGFRYNSPNVAQGIRVSGYFGKFRRILVHRTLPSIIHSKQCTGNESRGCALCRCSTHYNFLVLFQIQSHNSTL